MRKGQSRADTKADAELARADAFASIRRAKRTSKSAAFTGLCALHRRVAFRPEKKTLLVCALCTEARPSGQKRKTLLVCALCTEEWPLRPEKKNPTGLCALHRRVAFRPEKKTLLVSTLCTEARPLRPEKKNPTGLCALHRNEAAQARKQKNIMAKGGRLWIFSKISPCFRNFSAAAGTFTPGATISRAAFFAPTVRRKPFLRQLFLCWGVRTGFSGLPGRKVCLRLWEPPLA